MIDLLDYRELPGQNSLFLYYLYEYEKIRDFYAGPALVSSTVARRVESVLRCPRSPRKPLLDSLQDLNRDLGASAGVLSNIERLNEPDTVAVLTGQQLGLFGGPAFSVYKAATAVRLAQWLEGLGYPAVPVFWLAADDSDFEEVRTTYFVNHLGQSTPVYYPKYPERLEQMVGTIELGAIQPCLDAFRSIFEHLNSAFVTPAHLLLEHCYSPQHTFRRAFGLWISRLFKQYGLIVFDPLVPGYRSELADFFLTAINNRKRMVLRLLSTEKNLKSRGFLPQVKVEENETFLFRVDQKQRRKIRFESGLFQTKGPDRLRLSPEEFSWLIQREPERFGTSVLLRPILQDHLFPTVAYVGGPAEVAYFSQVASISSTWGLQPSIYPRASFTLIDRLSERLLKKYRFRVEDILTSPRAALTEKILREGEFQSVLQKIDSIRSQVVEKMRELQDEVSGLDQPLSGMVANSQKKILYHVEKINHRFLANRENSEPHLKRHLEHLQNRLLPRGRLQERMINFNQFLAEEGEELIHKLVESIEPGHFGHVVLRL